MQSEFDPRNVAGVIRGDDLGEASFIRVVYPKLSRYMGHDTVVTIDQEQATFNFHVGMIFKTPVSVTIPFDGFLNEEIERKILEEVVTVPTNS